MITNKLEERLSDYLDTFERAVRQKIEREREMLKNDPERGWYTGGGMCSDLRLCEAW